MCGGPGAYGGGDEELSFLATTTRSYDHTAAAYSEKTLAIDTGKQIATFNSHLKPDSLILDVGCGPGRDAKRFVDLGHRVIGIDLSEKLLDIARLHAPGANFHYMDLQHLRFPDASFDGVWAMSVLMHLEKKDLPGALTECARVLKPNGPFYLSLKRGEGEGLENDARYGVQKYFAYYTDREAQDLLWGLGLDVLEFETAGTIDQSYATKPWMDIFLRKRSV